MAAETYHPFRQERDDACDAGLAENLEVVGLDSGHGGNQVQVSFRLVGQRHCFHYSEGI